MPLHGRLHPQWLWQFLRFPVTLLVNGGLTVSMPLHGRLHSEFAPTDLNPYASGVSIPLHGRIHPQWLWQFLRLWVTNFPVNRELTPLMPLHGSIHPQPL